MNLDAEPGSTRMSRRAALRLAAGATLTAASGALLGTALAGTASAAVGAMVWPCSGTVTSLIGPRGAKQHRGIDVGAAQGTDIVAAHAGTVRVTRTANSGGFGNLVTITEGTWVTYYAHLVDTAIPDTLNGKRVGQGTLIGRVGSTGNSTGPHLHFEARLNGSTFRDLNLGTSQGARVTRGAAIPVQFPGLGAAPPDNYFRAMARNNSGDGYWLGARDGGVFTFGAAGFHGSMGGRQLNAPIVGMAAHPSGNGYWLVGSDGGIFAYGAATFRGSMGGQRLNAPIVGMAAHPSGNGYWLVGSDGGIFAFNAPFKGSMGGRPLNKPMVGMAAHPSGNGYWLVGSDGGIFAFGAPFAGSAGGQQLNAPVVGMAAHPGGNGYWLAASDGGVFAYGAPFKGSLGGTRLARPVVGIEGTSSGNGYWMVAGDGGVFAYGDAVFTGNGVNFDPN